MSAPLTVVPETGGGHDQGGGVKSSYRWHHQQKHLWSRFPHPARPEPSRPVWFRRRTGRRTMMSGEVQESTPGRFGGSPMDPRPSPPVFSRTQREGSRAGSLHRLIPYFRTQSEPGGSGPGRPPLDKMNSDGAERRSTLSLVGRRLSSWSQRIGRFLSVSEDLQEDRGGSGRRACC